MAGDTEELYGLLQEGKCQELRLRHALTGEVYEKLKYKTTSFGGTLGDCIRTGCENANRPGIGVRACDTDAYSTFAPLMNSIIKEYHMVDNLAHPPCDFGDLEKLHLDLGDVDPDGTYIKSTRVRVARSLVGYSYHVLLTHQDRLDLERTIADGLHQLKGEFQGEYHPIAEMSRETQDQLVKDHFLFNDFNSITKSAGGYRDWPTGRGIFYNKDKTFLVWAEEGDHMRIISMQPGSDLKAVYTRLVKGVKALETKGLTFVRDNRLGYLTFCPTNLGNTLRASVHIEIPLLSQSAHFHEFCAEYKLQIRGVDGDETSISGDVYDISNKRRLGITEIEAVMEMQEGVKAVIEEEKRLSRQ